jgi:hypothetical protein
MTYKSPFLVIQDFLSKDDATKLANEVKIELSKTDDEIIIPSERHILDKETSLYEKLKNYLPQIEDHFGLKVRGVEHLMFQQFPVSKDPAEQPQCANSVFKRKKWIKVKKIMFTMVDDIKICINRPCSKHKVSFDLAIVHSLGLNTYRIKEYIQDINLLL